MKTPTLLTSSIAVAFVMSPSKSEASTIASDFGDMDVPSVILDAPSPCPEATSDGYPEDDCWMEAGRFVAAAGVCAITVGIPALKVAKAIKAARAAAKAGKKGKKGRGPDDDIELDAVGDLPVWLQVARGVFGAFICQDMWDSGWDLGECLWGEEGQ